MSRGRESKTRICFPATPNDLKHGKESLADQKLSGARLICIRVLLELGSLVVYAGKATNSNAHSANRQYVNIDQDAVLSNFYMFN